ncbi:MAG: DUF4399 domain-containing protein [Marivibrio sp.]|uniref:DUF4399 domain-containing protein n=1 Tax=Marivibrio sp. TaxID=2039719 RepID=UPI0032ED9B34
MRTLLSAAALAALTLAAAPTALAQDTPAPEGARVAFSSPAPGSIIYGSQVHVIMYAEGVDIVPAGTDEPASGHHHLLINTEYEEMDQPIPADDRHVHFGGGQTEMIITLPPGEHRLQLLLGDQNHVPHDPPVMSDPIFITVKRAAGYMANGRME